MRGECVCVCMCERLEDIGVIFLEIGCRRELRVCRLDIYVTGVSTRAVRYLLYTCK